MRQSRHMVPHIVEFAEKIAKAFKQYGDDVDKICRKEQKEIERVLRTKGQ